MIHPQHGVKDCYGMSEVQSLTAHGWCLLNSGEAPDYSKKAAAPAPTLMQTFRQAVDEVRAMSPETVKALTEEVPPESSDILDGTVVQIVALFPAMTKAELESLRAREEAGKTRKGLMKALDEAIEAR
jgi:hypothetical protein